MAWASPKRYRPIEHPSNTLIWTRCDLIWPTIHLLRHRGATKTIISPRATYKHVFTCVFMSLGIEGKHLRDREGGGGGMKKDIMQWAKRSTAHHKWTTDGDECETMRIRDYPCLSLPPLFLPSPRHLTEILPEKEEEVRFQVMRFPGKSRKREERLSKSCLRWIVGGDEKLD